MVVLNKIYTKTGDDGTTGLGNGERRKKDDTRIEAYGTVDELNALLGVTRLHTQEDADIDAVLGRIQNDLFDLGADLCTPETDEPLDYEPLRITQKQVDDLEADIDHFNKGLPTLRSFVLPGGTVAAAHLHHARTVARRAERFVIKAAAHEPINKAACLYLNRLSDLFFVLSRFLNAKADGDVLWVPGKNR
jgi:cob(I)alamin adenosyltransferase